LAAEMAQSEIATKLRAYSIPVGSKNNSLFRKMSRLVQGPSHKLVQWITRSLHWGVKQPRW